ncbi:hypothetical protein FGO68_gene10525 [Halteria grandinella]|uniref:Uncharacterized protein n=1 Tax=Halteria grandinella TaxID=5974 RepID=A0A8J8P3S0_HALGN|nr:hypothetical protein FGO68_gene10525 [Halteria grandinella]
MMRQSRLKRQNIRLSKYYTYMVTTRMPIMNTYTRLHRLLPLLLSTLSLVKCLNLIKAPFPIIMGGSNALTQYSAMDYFPAANGELLATGGLTFDTDLSTVAGGQRALLSLYAGNCFGLVWSKVFANDNREFTDVAFSFDGLKIVALTLGNGASNWVMSFDAAKGHVLSSNQYINNEYDSKNEPNVLMDSFGNIYISSMLSTSPTAWTGFHIFKFRPIPPSTAPLTQWQFYTAGGLADATKGIKWSEDESTLITAVALGGTPRLYRIDANSGTSKGYNFGTSTYNAVFSTTYAAPYSVTVACQGAPTGMKELLRVKVDKVTPANSDIIQSWGVPNPNGGSDNLYFMDLFLESVDQVHIAFLGAISIHIPEVTNYILSIDLSLPLATTLTYVPIMRYVDDFKQLRIYSATKAFLVSSYTSFEQSGTTTITVGTYKAGMIFGSLIDGGTTSCQDPRVITPVATTQRTTSAFGNSAITGPSLLLSWAAFYLPDELLDYSTQSDFKDLDTSKIKKLSPSSVCEVSSLFPSYYGKLDSTQTFTGTWNYVSAYEFLQYHTITPFTYKTVCGAVKQWTYSIPATYPWLTIDPVTGTLFIAPFSSTAVTTSITVTGILSAGFTANFVLQINGIINTPPVISPNILSDQQLKIGESLTLTVIATDLEEVPTVQIYELNSQASPTYASVSPSCAGFICTATIVVNFSPQMSPGANHYLIKASDPYYVRSVTLTVYAPSNSNSKIAQQLKNLGPPLFSDILKPLTIPLGSTLLFNLPPIFDPDGDSFNISLAFKEASIYSSYQNRVINFTLPSSDFNLIKKYPVDITLTDFNPGFAKSKTYTMQVQIVNRTITGNGTIPQMIENVTSRRGGIKERTYPKYIPRIWGGMRILRTNNIGEILIRISGAEKYSKAIVTAIEEADLQVSIEGQKVKHKIIEKDPLGVAFTLKLEMSEPQLVSIGQDLDIVIVKMINEVVIEIFEEFNTSSRILSAKLSKIFIIQEGASNSKVIPPQLSSPFLNTQQFIEDNTASAQYFVLSSFALVNIFLAFVMNYIWEVINDISHLMILSLISINIPSFVQTIQSVFLSFIYLDLLQTDQWLPQIIYPGIDSDEEEGLNEYFEMNGFGSMRFANNLGSTFVFVWIFLIWHIMLGFLRLFIKGLCKCCDGKIEIWTKEYYWDGTIRFFVQQFTPLAIASTINLYDVSLLYLYLI